MRTEFSNMRNVRIVDTADNGPVYRCTVDLNIYKIDPISGNEFLHPDSGPFEYVAHPDDIHGIGPDIYEDIQNNNFSGEVEDVREKK